MMNGTRCKALVAFGFGKGVWAWRFHRDVCALLRFCCVLCLLSTAFASPLHPSSIFHHHTARVHHARPCASSSTRIHRPPLHPPQPSCTLFYPPPSSPSILHPHPLTSSFLLKSLLSSPILFHISQPSPLSSIFHLSPSRPLDPQLQRSASPCTHQQPREPTSENDR